MGNPSCRLYDTRLKTCIGEGEVTLDEGVAYVHLDVSSDISDNIDILNQVYIIAEGINNPLYGFINSYDKENLNLDIVLQMDISIEKRKEVRVPHCKDIILDRINDLKLTKANAKMVNISLGGLSFESIERFSVGDRLIYYFDYMGYKNPILCKIVWANRTINKYGVAFTTLTNNESMLVYNFVRELLNSKSSSIAINV